MSIRFFGQFGNKFRDQSTSANDIAGIVYLFRMFSFLRRNQLDMYIGDEIGRDNFP
jgi:hypothetical protein